MARLFSPSTLLISPAPKPVKVLLCLGRVTPAGLTEPCMSTMGAPMEGRRSLRGTLSGGVSGVAIVTVARAMVDKVELLAKYC